MSEAIAISVLLEQMVIGDSGLREPKKGVYLAPNMEYYMGASTSPDHIFVTKVDEKWIHYIELPLRKSSKERKIQRWIGEDLISDGSSTQIKHLKQIYSVYKMAWMKEMLKHLEAVLDGKKGKTTKLADLEEYDVFVKPAGYKGNDAWGELDNYTGGGVRGQNMETGEYEVGATGKKGIAALKRKFGKDFEIVRTEKS